MGNVKGGKRERYKFKFFLAASSLPWFGILATLRLKAVP